MKDELIVLLLAYIQRSVNLDAIDDWIGANVRNASGDAKILIDEVSLHLAYFDDGYSDEDNFRAEMAQVLQPTSKTSVGYQARERKGLGGVGIDVGSTLPRPPGRGLVQVLTGPPSGTLNTYS